MYKYAFLGTGNMGSALATAVSQKTDPKDVILANKTAVKAEALSETLGCDCGSVIDAAKSAKYVILGVKPQVLQTLFEEIKEPLKVKMQATILVTMAAGVKMSTLCEIAGKDYPVIRIMPNTPVAIGKGVILATRNKKVSDEDFKTFIEDFEFAGKIVTMEESLIDAGSVISGCGPAYIYMYMDALAKAGEKLGLDYDTAVSLAMATTEGSAALAGASDADLDDLRIAVCSPGGSTIEGVKSFWNSDFSETVENALGAAYKRTKELAGE